MTKVATCLKRVKKNVYKNAGKHSNFLNTSVLPKRHRQTVQTQIRLLLKKQPDQSLPCLLLKQKKDFQP